MALSPAQIQQYLGGVDYPSSKEDLIEHAREEGAEDDVIDMIEGLPMDRFNSPNDVSEAISGMDEEEDEEE